MVRYAVDHYGVDANRAFATGVSSGAMMTNVLLADYPDVFKAGAAFAGVPYTCFATASGSWNSDCATGRISRTAPQWGDLVRANNPGSRGPWPRLMLWHGTADQTVSYHNFGEEIKQWTDVNGVPQTPARTDNVGNGVTRTLYNDAGGNTRVEAYSMSGVSHSLPYDAAAVVRFFGLDGTATPPAATPSAPSTATRPTTPTPTATGQAPNGYPYCVNGSASDPDGDGWGWENNASCVVRGSAADPAPATSTTRTAPGGARSCTAAVTVANAWDGSFVANVVVSAGTAISGWTVTLQLPAGVRVSNGWDGDFTGNQGSVSVRNQNWNGAVGPGSTSSFGFQATGPGGTVPATCAAA